MEMAYTQERKKERKGREGGWKERKEERKGRKEGGKEEEKEREREHLY